MLYIQEILAGRRHHKFAGPGQRRTPKISSVPEKGEETPSDGCGSEAFSVTRFETEPRL
jgi:hypothetical protein